MRQLIGYGLIVALIAAGIAGLWWRRYNSRDRRERRRRAQERRRREAERRETPRE